MILTVTCQEIEVMRFLSLFHLCLFLSHINQATKKQFIKKLLSNSKYGISNTKGKFLPHR